MPLPSSGAISLSQVNVELGLSATAQISMNASNVRTLFGRASGAISMSDGYGKANQFTLTISSNQTNADLRTLALNAGWNGTSKVVATINSGVYCSSNSTGTPGLTISGSFPGTVELTNNGYITGMGGAGGSGRNVSSDIGSGGSAGSSGGLALSVSTAISIRNNGTIGGGGGGGGGGQARSAEEGYTRWRTAGGGGGGGRSGATNSAGGAGGSTSGPDVNRPGSAGGSGTSASAGGGGAGGVFDGSRRGGNGGAGGGWGSGGSSGLSGAGGFDRGGPFGAGGAGAAISGNGNITWLATGTRLGAIS